MGAKLLEVGVNPKTAIYRWKSEIKGNSEVLTCSAYWGESRTKVEAIEAAGGQVDHLPPSED